MQQHYWSRYYMSRDELAEDTCTHCGTTGCDYVDFLGMPWHTACFFG